MSLYPGTGREVKSTLEEMDAVFRGIIKSYIWLSKGFAILFRRLWHHEKGIH
jgi:hypothetical protein